MRFSLLLPALAIVLLAQTPTAFADTIIGTAGSGTMSVDYFGAVPNTPSYGESFSSPGGTLSSFTFFSIIDIVGTYAEFVVAPLHGATPGPALYSGKYALTSGSNTFSNLNVATTLGSEYLAYLTTFDVTGDVVTSAVFRVNESYAGGSVYYLNGSGNPTGSAFNELSMYDFVFSATFTPAIAVTPEPSGLMLLATGMMATAGLVRRRGRRA